ncbi:MAG: hypothetical protein AAFN77_17575 [Planctomycetota bacterium]
MIVEEQAFGTYLEWLSGGLFQFGIVMVSAVVVGVFFGYLIAALKHGPFEAFYIVSQVIGQAFPDFVFTSPRRVFAIARLAVKEALRRKVILVTFAIFAASLLFGGWFMNSGSDHPDRIYVNFVMFGTQLLVLLMGMLISAFSLPEDLKNKTIFTVVTKPVRATEIVLGRIVGFGFLGTMLLMLMGLISFVFVYRGLAHNHQIVGNEQTLASFVDVPEDLRSELTGRRVSDEAFMEAQTNVVSGHAHALELLRDIRSPNDPEPLQKTNIINQIQLPDGRIEYHRIKCVETAGHTHRVIVDGEGDTATIRLGPAVGFFRARVPVMASELQFFGRDGEPKKGGYSVGKESTYRGYIDGGDYRSRTSLSKAEFSFFDFRPELFPSLEQGKAPFVQLELRLMVFRTHKGDIEKRVGAGVRFESIVGEGEETFKSDMIEFETKEFATQILPIPRKIVGKVYDSKDRLIREGEYDLFDDYARNGSLKLVLKCRDYNQYLGVARGEVYFRSADHPYWLNFLKGYAGVWCQMMIIISLGVALSTFLNTPITMLGAMVLIIIGFFREFIQEMTLPTHAGGGPIESFIRVITQQNMVYEQDTNWFNTLVTQVDKGLVQILNGLTYLAPDFSRLNFSEMLTQGFAIKGDSVGVAFTLTLIFCAGLTVLGYFALKTREIAK